MGLDTPFWYKIAEYWHHNENGHGGPTIPFLVGVQHLDEFKSDTACKIDIATLLSELRDYNAPQPVFLKICGDLKEYVVSLFHKNYDAKFWGVKSDGYLLIEKEIIERCGTFDNIISDLTENYADIISKGGYSLNGWPRKWGPYSNRDKKILDSALR